MDKIAFEKLARLSGRGIAKALGTLERKGMDIRKAVATPVGRIPRRSPQKPKGR